jgi:type I restriction enzyme S subunit
MTFKEVQLQDVLDISWGDTKTTKASYVPSGFVAYSAKGPDGFLEKFDYDQDGVVLSAIGANCGSTFYAMGKWSCIKNTIRIIPKSEDIDLKYFYYMTKAPNFWPIRGSAQPFISQTDIREIYVRLPEVEKQQVIGRMLHEIELKIEVNGQLSKTLEDIAQTIFKSWFIDFDPVRAKMAGEKPVGMDAATAALFPDSMEDSELGLIPCGWAWKTVGDIADVIDCLHSKKPELLEAGLPYLQLDAISNDGVLRFDKAGKISEEDYKKWTARIEVAGGDCLITNVGRVGAVSQVPNHFKGAIGRNLTAMRPISMEKHRTLLVSALTSDFMAGEITKNTDAGTILEALNVRSIPRLRVPVPNDEILHVFELTCGPMWLQAHELHRQNVQLAVLRDSLLPRLISGELQIPEEMLAS